MKKIFLLTAAIATLGLASCSIDDVENISGLSTEGFPASEEDAIATARQPAVLLSLYGLPGQ